MSRLPNTFEILKESELPSDYVVLDFETTGFNSVSDQIIQIACIRYRKDMKEGEFVSYAHATAIPAKITKLTGITVKQCCHAPKLEALIPQLVNFIGDDVVVAHNASFDLGFLIRYMNEFGIRIRPILYADTLTLAKKKIKGVQNYKLTTLKAMLGLHYNSHSAKDDCYVCHEVYKHCRGISSLAKNDVGELSEVANTPTNSNEDASTLEASEHFKLLIKEAQELEDANLTEKAISIYEECVKNQCNINTPYDRLILLYRKKREKESEIRILELATIIFIQEKKYCIRLRKIVEK